MKRLVFSVVGGVVIPFLYMVIVGPLTTYIQDDRLKQSMGYPVRWPVIILQRLLHSVRFLSEMKMNYFYYC